MTNDSPRESDKHEDTVDQPSDPTPVIDLGDEPQTSRQAAAPQERPAPSRPAGAEVPETATSVPPRQRGPNASAIVLGLVCVVVAGLAIARETVDFRVDWAAFGPGSIIVVGVLLLLLGVVGLVRRKD